MPAPSEQPLEHTRKAGTTLAELPEPAQRLASASLSSNTRRALARLDAWIESIGDSLTDITLAAYLATLHDAGRAPPPLARSSPRSASPPAGTPNPAGPATARVLAGARREGRHRGRRDAATLSVMSDTMLRRSECASLDVDDVQPSPTAPATSPSGTRRPTPTAKTPSSSLAENSII